MYDRRKDIIAELKKTILPLQGYKLSPAGHMGNTGLGPIESAFPDGCFPFAAIHEFISAEAEHAAATAGFISGLLSSFMKNEGVAVWISSSRTIFPPALKLFGIDPGHVIFIDLQKEKDVLWVMEETLKCDGLAAVIGEIKKLDFTTSRRLQLTVEQSGVTAFIIHHCKGSPGTTTCVSRWKINPVSSETDNDMPGIGFPRWNVELLKIRNGKPGRWQLEWAAGSFRHIAPLITSVPEQEKRKVG